MKRTRLTPRRGATLFVIYLLGLCGCYGDKGGDDSGTASVVSCDEGYVFCVDGREWTGDAGFCFLCQDGYCYNYACDTAPIDAHFLLDPGSFVGVGDGIPDEGSVHDALDVARSKWNDLGASVTIEHDSSDEVDPGLQDPGDYENHVAMTDGYGTDFSGLQAYATTTWTADVTGEVDEAGEPEYVLVDCDIEVFSQYYDEDFEAYVYSLWDLTDDASVMGTYEISLPTLLGHELGHCLGFGHNSLSGSMMEVPISNLYDARIPSSDDEDALEYLYE